MIDFRMGPSRLWVKRSLIDAQRRGQQAFPHGKYPLGQADADVTTQIVANIATSIPRTLMVRMTLS
jgi:hypothetical protein